MDKEKERKIPIPPLIMVGISIAPFVLYYAVKLSIMLSPYIGLDIPNCSEGSFWPNAFYGIVASLGMSGLISALIMIGYGIARILARKTLGILSIILGILLIILNLYITMATLEWFVSTSGDAIYDSAISELEELADAQEAFHKSNNRFAEDIGKLGKFSFTSVGTVEITSADDKCYRAEAAHTCLNKIVAWDSCNGGLVRK